MPRRSALGLADCWGSGHAYRHVGAFRDFDIDGVGAVVRATYLKTEPLVLAPYEMVLVQDGSCSSGKILRVMGAIRGLRRKKSCVAAGGSQASLGLIQ